jgi:hypothetical protein
VLANGAEMCLTVESFIILDAHRQLTPNASVRTIQIAIITRCSSPMAAVLITGSKDRLASKLPTESVAPFLPVGVIRGGWKTEASVASPRANQNCRIPANWRKVANRVDPSSGTFGLHLGFSIEHLFGIAVAAYVLMDLSNSLKAEILTDASRWFWNRRLIGIEPNKKRIREHLDNCLMLVTKLNLIGEQFDSWVRPDEMTHLLRGVR